MKLSEIEQTCCEELRQLEGKGFFVDSGFISQKPTIYAAVQISHDSWSDEEVIIKYCPFCGKELK